MAQPGPGRNSRPDPVTAMSRLERCISMNPSQRNEPPSTAIMAITLQALIGAIWLDSQRGLQDMRPAGLKHEIP
jgi:dsRNA-specific ribonuclease